MDEPRDDRSPGSTDVVIVGRRDDEERQRAEEARREQSSGPEGGRPQALLPGEETEHFRRRWDEIQSGFVDEPRGAVERGDSLVAEVMKRLADTFADERSRLEQQWSRGDQVSTEDLRVALQRYRSFFDRLLSM